MAHIRQPGRNLAHTRPSGPESGLGFQSKGLKTLQIVPYSLECGSDRTSLAPAAHRAPAIMAHARQSGPESGLGFQSKGLHTFQRVSCALECSSGLRKHARLCVPCSQEHRHHPNPHLSSCPCSCEHGTRETVKTRFWPWLSVKRPSHLSTCFMCARMQLRAEEACASSFPCSCEHGTHRQPGPDSGLGF